MIKIVCDGELGLSTYVCNSKIDFSTKGDKIRFVTINDHYKEILVENVFGIYPVKGKKS